MGENKSDPSESARRLEQFRAMHHETTDPMAARLLGDIVSELEATSPTEKSNGEEPRA